MKDAGIGTEAQRRSINEAGSMVIATIIRSTATTVTGTMGTRPLKATVGIMDPRTPKGDPRTPKGDPKIPRGDPKIPRDPRAVAGGAS